jgi:DNA recombination protein RmuC
MTIALYVLGSLIVGGVVAWLLSANRTRSKYEQTLQETRDRASSAEGKVSTLEGTVAELRTQSEQRSAKAAEDFDKLRADLSTEKEARVKAETQAKETVNRLEEEKKLLADAKEKLTDAFKSLAGDTLDNTTSSFLKLAKETFEKVLTEAKGDLGQRQEAIQGLVKPLSESLKQFEAHVREMEKNREGAYSGIKEHLENVVSVQQQLQKETGNLVSALRTPQVRGRWGEMTLRRVVELAGMSEHSDFTEQVSVQSDTGRLVPDMIVHLPAEREIVVDAKVSLDAYLKATSAESEDERKEFFATHAKQIRTHMKSLGGKAYWNQFENTPEIVVMFIPGESFLAAAAHYDHSLIEDGMEMRVVLATPTTLIAVLRAVAFGWRQEQIAKNAQIVSDLGKQLYERMRVLAGHIDQVGNGLEKANSAYSKAVSSMESRVLPAARRFKDLGVAAGDDIPILEPIETTPRSLGIPETTGDEEDSE